jgi:hypothetical protein
MAVWIYGSNPVPIQEYFPTQEYIRKRSIFVSGIILFIAGTRLISDLFKLNNKK